MRLNRHRRHPQAVRRGGEIGAALVAVLLARTAVNGGIRLAYPFLPEIARGLGVSLGVAGVLLAVRSAAGLIAPLVAPAAERAGRRTLMLGGVAATLAGCLVVVAAEWYDPGLVVAGTSGVLTVGAGFVLIGAAKPLFDVPMQGWFGSRVPYERRGRVLGISELAWALSLALALPASLLIPAVGWPAPFVLVAGVAVLGGAAVTALMASDRPRERVRRPLRLTPVVVRILAVVVLFRFAGEVLFVVYGAWLEDDFGLTVTAIGVFTLLVVGSELVGEAAVAGVSDRLGLKRSVLFGLLGSGVVYASLGLVGDTLVAGMAAVVGWFALFEITIVATIPLVTELAGEARDRLLGLIATVNVASTGVAALVAPHVYAAGGIALCGLLAAGCVAVAAGLLVTVPAPAAGQRSAGSTSRS